MTRLVITRPTGEVEYAELTTDKSLVSDNCLKVQKNGTTYWAKLDKALSTHMYVLKPTGEKVYVQKKPAFTWKYIVNTNHPINGFTIPKTGKYRIYFHQVENMDGHFFEESDYSFTRDFVKGETPNKYNEITTKDNRKVRLGYKTLSPSIGDHDSHMIAIEYIGEC